MSKLLDNLRKAEEARSAGKPRESPDVEAAIEEVAELRSRIESERNAEQASQALEELERKAAELVAKRKLQEEEAERQAAAAAAERAGAENSLRATEQALAASESALLEATRAREARERVARGTAMAHPVAGQGQDAERAQRRPGPWRLAVGVLAVLVAAGAGFYGGMRVLHPTVRAIAVDGPLVLRLDHNIAGIPASD